LSEFEKLDELNELIKKVREAIEDIKPELDVFELEYISWSDDARGKPASVTLVHGVEIKDLDLLYGIDDVVNLAYEDEAGQKVVVDAVYMTIEEGLVAQLHKDVENQYGRHVGTERWYVLIPTIIEVARKTVSKSTHEKLRQKIRQVLTQL